MPIRVEWAQGISNTIHSYLEGKWTWREVYAAFQEEMAMAATLGTARCDVIADHLSSEYVPLGPGVSHVHRLNQQRLQRQPDRLVVVVTTSRFIAGMVSIGKQVYPRQNDNFRTVDTVAKAIALIEQDRAGKS
jgi:hypothetical protein